jgi:hypothetical protein
MSDRIIVLVSDLDDASHGEVNVLESHDQAAHFVETLLESGFEQERVRIFGGDELQMQVHHRPVVSLLNQNPNQNGRGQKDDLGQDETSPQSQLNEEEEEAIRATPAPRVARSLEYEEAEAEPFVQNGVRFSSMFKPA